MHNKIAPMTQSLFPDNIIIQEEFIDCSGNLTPTWHCLIIDFELDNYFRHGGGVLMMRSGGVTVAGSEINSSASRTQQVSKFGEIAQLRLWLLRKIFITFNRSFPDCSKSEFCGLAISCHSELLGVIFWHHEFQRKLSARGRRQFYTDCAWLSRQCCLSN